MRSPLLSVVLACHVLLALTVAALLYTAASSPLAGAVLALAAAAPLLATLRGVATSPRTRQWVALLLVVYAGATSIEVVATSGAAVLASGALLTAVLELGALLVLIRRSGSRRPTVRE
jgi:uncharacterized membrane protein